MTRAAEKDALRWTDRVFGVSSRLEAKSGSRARSFGWALLPAPIASLGLVGLRVFLPRPLAVPVVSSLGLLLFFAYFVVLLLIAASRRRRVPTIETYGDPTPVGARASPKGLSRRSA